MMASMASLDPLAMTLRQSPRMTLLAIFAIAVTLAAAAKGKKDTGNHDQENDMLELKLRYGCIHT